MLKATPAPIVSVGVSILSKLCNAFMQIMLIPIFISKLGIGDFALYNFLIGISGWFVLCDLSTSTIIQNQISKNELKNEDSSHLISYSFYLNLLLFAAFYIFLLLISPLMIKFFMIKIYGYYSGLLVIIWIIFSALYLFNSLFLNVFKIYYAKNLAFKINLLTLLSVFLTFGSLILVTMLQSTNLLFWVIVFTVVPNILINLYAYIKIKDNLIRVKFRELISYAKTTIHSSRHLLMFTISGLLVIQLDYFLIAYYLTPKDIVQYNFCSRIFMAAFAFYSVILLNYYPHCSKLIYQNKWAEVLKNSYRYIAIGVFSISLCLVILLFGHTLIEQYFFRGKAQVSIMVMIIFAIYYIIRVWTDTLAIILTILNKGKSLFNYATLQLLISTPLQIFLIKLYGLVGLLFGLCISFIATASWMIPRKIFRLSKGGN